MALVRIGVAVEGLEAAIAAHSSEQAYSIGQMFLLALGKDTTLSGAAAAKRTLLLLADALS